jgi:transcriptional regulator with XRE-family HTH domain
MQTEYDLRMKWNDRLKQAFEAAAAAKGITQTDLAAACSVKPASVTDWLNGETKSIEAKNLLPACKLLGVSPFWVMFGDGNQYEFAKMSEAEPIEPSDAISLLASLAQSSDEGRKLIVESAEKTMRSFPRGGPAKD